VYHMFACVTIPLLAMLNIYITVAMAQNISRVLSITITQGPLLAGSIYAFAFILPYAYSYLVKRSFGED
jgi:hypothetical protein